MSCCGSSIAWIKWSEEADFYPQKPIIFIAVSLGGVATFLCFAFLFLLGCFLEGGGWLEMMDCVREEHLFVIHNKEVPTSFIHEWSKHKNNNYG